jgi:hypothetical protein
MERTWMLLWKRRRPSQHSVDEDTVDADCIEKKEGEDDDKKKD